MFKIMFPYYRAGYKIYRELISKVCIKNYFLHVHMLNGFETSAYIHKY